MYKLTYKGQFVDGFDADQVVGNLAQLLNLKPKAVRLAFLSERPSVIKILDSASEVERWCAAFQEAGVYLDVIGVDSPDAASISDQIELELELHQLDAEDDEPDERLYLIRKTPQESSTQPETFANEPLATRPVSAYPINPELIKPKVAVKPAVNGKAVNGAAVNGHSVAGTQPNVNQVNGHPVNGSHPHGKTNGSHASIVTAQEPIDISTSVAPTKKPSVAKPQPVAKEIPETAVHELSVAQIDALAARQLLDESEDGSTQTGDAVAAPAEPKNPAPDAPIEKLDHVKKPDVKKAAAATKTVAGQSQPESLDARQDRFNEEDFDVPLLDNESSLREWPDEELLTDEELSSREAQLAQEHDEELHEDVNFHKSHFVWGMLVILLAIIATAGTILWLKRSTWTPVTVAPQEIKVTEAIASSSLFGLLHADVDRLQMLSPGTDLFAYVAEPKSGFWDGLAKAGINVQQQADDVWMGVYGQNGQSKTLWVLSGNFPADTWREWLKKNYIIDNESPDGIIFSTVDDNTCEKSPVLSASISNNQIVVGAPELVAAFNGRLQAGAAAEKNLETWAKGYNTQMVSAVLFHPGQLPEGSAAMALGKLSLPAEPIQGIYLGLEPKSFPPALEFNAVVASNDQQFIVDAANKLTAAAASAKTTIATDWPETLPFYERMKIKHDANQVRATLNLDEQAPQQIHLWFSSLLSRAFGVENVAPVVEGERLESNPAQFITLPSAELPAFATVKHFNEAFIAQTSSGPFGIGIRTVERTEQGDEINLDVNAFNLPNLGKENDSVVLRITDIVDHQDKSLIAAGSCGGGLKQPGNINLVYQGNAMENGQPISFTGLQGTKKIILPVGVSLTSVGAVKGVITQQLPLDVERVNLNGPLAGKTLDVQGVQIRFLSAGPSRLYFQVSGNTTALLQVNALNEDGKQLASINTMRGENFYDSGKTISIDYQGKIAAAEVVVASKLEQKNYEFSIARIFPPAKPFLTEKFEPATLKANGLPALEKDTPPNDVVYPYQSPKQTIAAGPALIALNELNVSGQQLSLLADVYTRNTHPLTGQLSAVRFVISEIEDSSGNLHSVNYQVPIAMEHMGGGWMNGKYEPDPGRPWLRGQLEIRDRPLAQGDAVALWGKMVFLAMEDPLSVKAPFMFGMEWSNNGSTLKLRRWEAGRLIFDVEGNLPDFMAVKALDESGAVISQPAELRNNLGKITIELDVKQIPETIEFNLARTQKLKEFPLEIRVLQ
ncbi:hypothetical protein [Cellvibrio mixtus]|uniref:hypothetical protein n=1 Tax=Cellvibrio mixtus TaxID=39650 RepID=UPI0005870068|nr:hypothetical protein [Cellvibrio mixtus]